MYTHTSVLFTGIIARLARFLDINLVTYMETVLPQLRPTQQVMTKIFKLVLCIIYTQA